MVNDAAYRVMNDRDPMSAGKRWSPNPNSAMVCGALAKLNKGIKTGNKDGKDMHLLE